MTDPNPHQDPSQAHSHLPHPLQQPAQQPDRSADEPSLPDAAVEDRRASEFATHGDPTLRPAAGQPGEGRRGVQWVRATDLAARAGGVVLERGAEWNTRLRDAALEGIREARAQMQERLARRQQELEPDTVSPDRVAGRELGRTVVSR